MKKVPQKSLKQKSLVITDQALMLGFFGRDGVIRTLDPLHPIQVRTISTVSNKIQRQLVKPLILLAYS
ncbi:hypothetical protein F469_04658 [Pseudomonas sp. URMO17WK12:I2]|nr:hypothetical protein F469_04658 [Pseudomonas sp. URMO17WK12:I2]